MFLGTMMVVVGLAMQIFSWYRYRRDYAKFWVSRPIWYYLYPRGSVLFIAGVWIALAGLVVYHKS